MGIILLGFGVAAVSYLFKPVGIIIAVVALAPLVAAFMSGPIQVMIDPSSVGAATGGIVTAFTNCLTGEILSYPGAALFGALIGLFSPGGYAG
jgi:hypothetical protein